jgi:hypothetical protein
MMHGHMNVRFGNLDVILLEMIFKKCKYVAVGIDFVIVDRTGC